MNARLNTHTLLRLVSSPAEVIMASMRAEELPITSAVSILDVALVSVLKT